MAMVARRRRALKPDYFSYTGCAYALRPQVAQGRRWIALGELLALGIEDQTMMVVGGRRQPQNLLQQAMNGRRLVKIEAADDVRDALKRVVQHAGKVVACRRLLAAEDHVAPALGRGRDLLRRAAAGLDPC